MIGPAIVRSAVVVLGLLLLPVRDVLAYPVEADSATNTVFVLLRNLHPTAVFESISITETPPGFVSQVAASIIPGTIPGGGSDLAAIEFDVAAGAVLGSTGDLTLTVSGSASGQAIDVVLLVPLEVAAAAPTAQGVVGVGVPAPDPGGPDSDSDGVSDALEVAFGSDPFNAASLPGQASAAALPLFEVSGFAFLAGLLLLCGMWLLACRDPHERLT
ncbi:MAG: thrombospondin type 3 repeat-containing protein [Myxococcota bacterium]|nr:thrombospondin type 3 repeat-containing protein [Myxococcota bacterium]